MTLHATHLLNAFLLAVVLIIALGKLAEPAGLVDRPNARKLHEGCIPVVGGVAMFAAFMVTVLLVEWPQRAPWGLVSGLFILVAIGIVDDIRDLRPRVRLAVQAVAAAVMVVPDWHVVRELAELGAGRIDLGVLALPFTLFLIVGAINAYNMLDGLDGLAGGAAAAAFFWLAVVAGAERHGGQATVLVLLAATLGFLVFNLPHPWRLRASVFMGDAGSTMLGASIAFFIVVLASAPAPTAPLPGLLWICALPAIDTLSLILRRIHGGRSPFAADRRHLHHLLLDLGFSARRAAGLIVLASFVLGGVGVAGILAGVPDPVMLAGLAVPLAAHIRFVRRAENRLRKGRPAGGGAVLQDAGLPIRSPGL
ncbi:MraY family glycosyltransferase [Arenibaculum pallidiluteum]|uniref:MraY family glycosyltransferase n=1 Tax=Arenibaculum pallidiluteum TaxID=2812559 RepID=UPI001A977021|nr:MraY family glycosyltransferase [Arenibaculum pallidiluteum]